MDLDILRLKYDNKCESLKNATHFGRSPTLGGIMIMSKPDSVYSSVPPVSTANES
jgi:hypothetical protein